MKEDLKKFLDDSDDSGEIETIEDSIGRKLTDEEEVQVSRMFIDKVLKNFYRG